MALDINSFKNAMNKYGWDCLMAIMFDNQSAFICDVCEYDEVQGPTSTERRNIRYLDPSTYIMVDEENELVGMKQRFQMKDRTHPLYDKAYFIEWKPIETIQGLVFCDQANKQIRPFFDTQHA